MFWIRVDPDGGSLWPARQFTWISRDCAHFHLQKPPERPILNIGGQANLADQPKKGLALMRLERYYNALIGRSRPGVAPTIEEARKDLNRAIETQFPFYG